MPKNLIDYAFNRFSQNGQDGIIEELCRRLGIVRGWGVEFGAWDGKHLSNTYSLLSRHGWQGVDIEGNAERYQELLLTAAEFKGRLHTICAFVGIEGEHTLDKLLATTPTPRDFDLLSIDIDSHDWEIWNSLQSYHPKIVVIESDATVPLGVIQRHHPPHQIGASFSALVELGKQKGYQLVCHTGNCIFVVNEAVNRLQLDPAVIQSPEKLFNRAKHFREKLIERGRAVLPDALMQCAFRASNRWKQIRKKQ